MKAINIQNKQWGLTLIELMIALVLGLLLVAGTIQVFISNKQTHRVTEAHSRIQENARFALEILTREIRGAGYSGCRSIDNMNIQNVANPAPTTMSPTTIITGSNGVAGSSAVPPPTSSTPLGTVVQGTDLITIQRGTGCGASLVGNVGSSSAQVQVYLPNSCNIKSGVALMIADCEDAHIFRASGVSDGSGPNANKQNISHGSNNNSSTHFCKSYADGASTTGSCETGEAKLYDYDSEVFLFSSNTYYISTNPAGNPSLYVYNEASSQAPLELVENIENLQIEYGVHGSNPNTVESNYFDAKAINDAAAWDKVISVRVSILAQTLETNLTTAAQQVTYGYDGAVISGTDGRIRRVFTSTIAVRNRVQ